MNHLLKTDGAMWDLVAQRRKTFEVRSEADRVFTAGDKVFLIPWDRAEQRVPPRHLQVNGAVVPMVQATVGVVVHGFGLPAEMCVFQLDSVDVTRVEVSLLRHWKAHGVPQ